MPRPTRNQIAQTRAFQRRQARAEKIYTTKIFRYLRKCYYSAAREVQNNGINADTYAVLDYEQLSNLFTKLYTKVILDEAKIAYKENILPYEENSRLQKKDFIDDFAELISGSNSNLIRMWRSLLDEFIEVRLTGKIQRINQTTQEAIRKLIEKGIFEGLGQDDIARLIRNETRRLGSNGTSILMNRARAIARTETVVSANQGKYISALSSNLQMKKKWLPVLDARTRDGGPGREANHRIMANKDWIPLKEDFRVPDEYGVEELASYPGDQRLSAGNVINCRCSIVFEPMRDSSGSLIRKR